METYMTSDLYLSAFLKVKGFRLISHKREGNKVTFIFQDKKDRERMVTQFFNDGPVGASSFKGALQDLKTIVFNT